MIQRQFIRFILVGGINTASSYLVYIFLLNFLSYGYSYTTAYVVGIFISYWLNRIYVFRRHNGVKSAMLFPLVYIFQYAVGIFLIWVIVDILRLSQFVAPLLSTLITIPLTFVLSSLVFSKR
jgi:putative flippase GtrA